jgi:hypothetical protein
VSLRGFSQAIFNASRPETTIGRLALSNDQTPTARKRMDLPRQHTPAPPRSIARTVRTAVTTGAVSIFCFSIGLAANFAIFAIVQAMLHRD